MHVCAPVRCIGVVFGRGHALTAQEFHRGGNLLCVNHAHLAVRVRAVLVLEQVGMQLLLDLLIAQHDQ